MRKLILAGLLASNFCAQANDDINYNFLEIGYGYLDIADNIHADGFYLDGAFDLSDRFYLGGFTDNRNVRNFDFNRYGARLGFHTNGSGKTDFYTEFEIGKLDINNINSTTLGLYGGTRTAFTQRFELISKIGYTHVDDINDSLFEAELKGLIKFSDSQALTVGVESFDGDFGAKIGYRFSF